MQPVKRAHATRRYSPPRSPACPGRKVGSRVWQGLVLNCAESRGLVFHDELVCKPMERDCGLGMVLASFPTRQVMLLRSV